MNAPMIQIIKTPDGEAPLWVREAWVGVILPCLDIMGYSSNHKRGVLTLKEKEQGKYCYHVPQKEALKILSSYSRNAAMWWYLNCYPKENPQECNFGFSEYEAIVIEGNVRRQKIIIYDDQERGHWHPV